MAYKQDKVSVSILKYVSDIIQFELKSSEIGFITVTGVEVTGDLSIAKIFVSFLDNKNVEKRRYVMTLTEERMKALAQHLELDEDVNPEEEITE